MGLPIGARRRALRLGDEGPRSGRAILRDGRVVEKTKIDTNQLLQRLSVPLCLVALIIVFGVLRPDAFLAARTISSILGSAAPVVVLTIATVVTLRGGDYDLSGAAVMTLASNIIGVLEHQVRCPDRAGNSGRRRDGGRRWIGELVLLHRGRSRQLHCHIGDEYDSSWDHPVDQQFEFLQRSLGLVGEFGHELGSSGYPIQLLCCIGDYCRSLADLRVHPGRAPPFVRR